VTLGQLNAWIVGWEMDREVLQTQGQKRKMKILLFGAYFMGEKYMNQFEISIS